MGGGTPSLFEPEWMDQLLTGVRQRLTLADGIEITMEANPGTTEHRDFGGYRQAGINRLSLGVQSFNANQLKQLGRIHSADDAKQAMQQANKGGFDNVNIDLMFGLPNQTIEAAQCDLENALSLKPQHLSLYQLTLEPNTVFHRYPPSLPGSDTTFAIQQSLQHTLSTQGWEQYEVSAYSQQDRQSKHNTNYWLFGDYLGIGAGAHGKITTYTAEKELVINRRARKKHPATYIDAAGGQIAIAEDKIVQPNEILFEFLMNSLRLRQGFKLDMAETRTGIDQSQIVSALAPAIQQQWLVNINNSIRCTDQGYLFLDSILESML